MRILRILVWECKCHSSQPDFPHPDSISRQGYDPLINSHCKLHFSCICTYHNCHEHIFVCCLLHSLFTLSPRSNIMLTHNRHKVDFLKTRWTKNLILVSTLPCTSEVTFGKSFNQAISCLGELIWGSNQIFMAKSYVNCKTLYSYNLPKGTMAE